MPDDIVMRRIEIGLVLTTAAIFLAIPKPPDATLPMAVFIPTCISFWAFFLIWRVRADPALKTQWGLVPSAHLGPLLVLLVAAGCAYALTTGQPLIADYLWVSMVLYPLWGGIQQWLVQCLIVDNARALTGAGLPWLMALGAIGFGAIHIQHPMLVIATGIMGAVYVYLFQRWRNLWPLAVCHGWLGSLFYPWVLHLNPMAEILGVVLDS